MSKPRCVRILSLLTIFLCLIHNKIRFYQLIYSKCEQASVTGEKIRSLLHGTEF